MQNIIRYILIVFLCASCGKRDLSVPDSPSPQRTIIVYFCGDNNLSSEIDAKINALRQGMKNTGKTDNNLIVYADYSSKLPRLTKITETEAVLTEEYPEHNSASPEVFSDILAKIINDYPAQGYGIICFSHASGWLPAGALNSPENFTPSAQEKLTRSIFEDKGNEMSIADFAAALPELPGGAKYDFIIFETCYMAGVEVAYELRNKTKYIVSSSAEILSAGFAEIYPDCLPGLFAPQPQLTEFARAYFDYRNSLSGTARSATVSVINTDGIDNLANTVGEIYSAAATAADVKNIQHFNRNSHRLFFDLYDYIQSLATPQQLTAFQNIISQTVEYEASTPYFMTGYPYAFIIRSHCGLTTYIKQSQFNALNKEYDKLGWTKACLFN